jgi:YVTN family beta-propeller protein
MKKHTRASLAAVALAAVVGFLAGIGAPAGAGLSHTLASVAATPSAVSLVPCSTLTRLHKPRPARCRKKAAPPLPSLGAIAATISIPSAAGDSPWIASGAGAIWYADSAGVTRVDPVSNTVVAHIPVAIDGQIVVADGAVFVADLTDSTLVRIDPATNSVAATIPVGLHPLGVASTPGAVWVANHHGWSVSRIDPATNTVVATIPIPGGLPGDPSGPNLITAGAGAVWVGVPQTHSIARIDPTTNTFTATIPGGDGCGTIAADDTAVWETNSDCGGSIVSRFDPKTNQYLLTPSIPAALTASGHPARNATGSAIVAGNAYIAINYPKPALVRIDEATNTVTGYLALPAAFNVCAPFCSGWSELVYSDGALWIGGLGVIAKVQLNN